MGNDIPGRAHYLAFMVTKYSTPGSLLFIFYIACINVTLQPPFRRFLPVLILLENAT
jgi:hypothetical protein